MMGFQLTQRPVTNESFNSSSSAYWYENDRKNEHAASLSPPVGQDLSIAIPVDGSRGREEDDSAAEIPNAKQQQASEIRAQKTPFGLNKYILLIINVIYAFATARVFFGWPSLSNILFRAGAYSWLCEGDNITGGSGRRYLCEQQDSAVQFLFVLGCATSFSCSLLSGSLMDWIGPKITAICGQIINCAAWCLLAFSQESCPTYIPAMLLMGLGADAGFLPASNVCNLFPKNEKLVIALVSAAMGASFAIPTILDVAWLNDPGLSLKELCLWYAAFGPALAAIAAALFIPRDIYISECELANCTTKSAAAATDTDVLEAPPPTSSVIGPCQDATSSVNSAEKAACSSDGSETTSRLAIVEGQGFSFGAFGLVEEKGYSDKFPNQIEEASLAHANVLEGTKQEPPCSKTDEISDTTVTDGSVETVGTVQDYRSDTNNEEDSSAASKSTRSLAQQLCSKHFWGIHIYWPLNALFYNYYLTSAESIFGTAVNDALGVMVPLSFIPSILLGKVADKYGVMSLIAFTVISGFFMYVFALVPALWSYYTSAVFSMLYVSCFSGQMYSYVNDTFQSVHFGKIVGLISATGGLLSLLRGTVHTYLTMGVFQGDFTYTCVLMLVLVIICSCIVVFLCFVKRAQPKAYLPAIVPFKVSCVSDTLHHPCNNIPP